ncbi:MAG: hypothetical protein HQM14_21220 [SAR324 cluster bacterium]|nr:hypothetical protein [SAR324 cluster bacterium]
MKIRSKQIRRKLKNYFTKKPNDPPFLIVIVPHDMEFYFFLFQLVGFFISVVVINFSINYFLLRRGYFDKKFLPCFAWGWCVYFLIYLLGRYFSASVEIVHLIFTGMALFIPLLAGFWYWLSFSSRIKKVLPLGLPHEKETLIFVSLFVGAMAFVGPYLEFPSDPLYHLSSIQHWETARWVDSVQGRSSHFMYFLSHWLLKPSNISWGHRAGLTIFCASLQGLLLWSFIRFTRVFTRSVKLGLLGGMASVGLFGTSIFSFYRYYVLADTFVSYLVFLEALVLVICCFYKERFRYLLLLPPLLVFCWNNHRQEVLLLLNAVIGIGTLLLIFKYRAFISRFRKLLLFVTGLGVVLVVLLWIATNIPKLTEAQLFYLQKLADRLADKPLYVISFSRLNAALGAAGWMAMNFAVLTLLFLRHNKQLAILACLCIWPLIVLWNPIATHIMLFTIPSSVLYRLVFGSMFWIFLVVFVDYLYKRRLNLLRWVPDWKFSKFQNRSVSLKFFITTVVFVGVMWFPQSPIQGKIYQLVHQAQDRLTGKDLEAAIQYLRQNAPSNCIDPYRAKGFWRVRHYVVGDAYVNSYLLATGYFHTISDRWETIYPQGEASHGFFYHSILKWFENLEEKDAPNFPEILKKRNVCYIIVSAENQIPSSRIGLISGHWAPNYLGSKKAYSVKLHGWVKKYSQFFQLVFQDQAVLIYKVL